MAHVWVLALLFLQDEQPLPKIAEVSAAGGTVEIVNPKGAVRKPVKFGTRWKNAEIRDEDRVKTAQGSQAVILFPDASKFTLKENSEIQILQKTLPKPTAEGNTVGRRIRVFVGEFVSDVIPNKEIRTDFEMPTGSAAVRGTSLRLTVAAGSATLTTSEGTVRFSNGKYSVRIDVGAGQAIRVTEGSVKIDVLEDGGRPLDARIGDRPVTFTADDRVVVDLAGANVSIDVQQGTIGVNGTETSEDQTCAPDAAIGEDAANFDPTADTAAPMPVEDAPPADLIGPDVTVDPMGATDLIESTTTVGTAGTPETVFSDNFDRADSLIVGNGWAEILDLGGSQVGDVFGVQNMGILNGNLNIFYAGGAADLEGRVTQDPGHFNTFEAQATFVYSGVIDEVFVGVNIDPVTDKGIFVDYFPSSGLLELEDGTGTLFNDPAAPVIGAGTAFTLLGSYDGTLICGTILNSGGGVIYNH